MSLAIALKATS